MTQQQQALAEAFEAALKRRNLSINALHQRSGISREALTKVKNGLPVDLVVLERLARFLGDDPNYWRELGGYEPLGPPTDAVVADVRAAWDELKAALDEAGLPHAAPTYHGGGGQQDEEDVAAAMRWLAQQLRENKAAGE